MKFMYEEGGKGDWKKNDSERHFYNERKQILQLVTMTAEEMHIPAVEAAQRVEGFRVRRTLSLKKLSKEIRKARTDPGMSAMLSEL